MTVRMGVDDYSGNNYGDGGHESLGFWGLFLFISLLLSFHYELRVANRYELSR